MSQIKIFMVRKKSIGRTFEGLFPFQLLCQPSSASLYERFPGFLALFFGLYVLSRMLMPFFLHSKLSNDQLSCAIQNRISAQVSFGWFRDSSHFG
jgi:hypothetical protein